jgi:hypothetical protein
MINCQVVRPTEGRPPFRVRVCCPAPLTPEEEHYNGRVQRVQRHWEVLQVQWYWHGMGQHRCHKELSKV